MLCGWEANRRSGITLAMHYRLSGLSTYGLNGGCEGDKHPTCDPARAWPLYLLPLRQCFLASIRFYFIVTEAHDSQMAGDGPATSQLQE